jgi:LmbE family N-acetylglucosaminyl deacetylase
VSATTAGDDSPTPTGTSAGASIGTPTTDLAVPTRVLAIGAHPDDIEFGCGATLAKWAALGAHCEMLVLTDGSKGTWDVDVDGAALRATREGEQRAAAKALGVAGVRFGRNVDGELEATPQTREHVCAVIRSARPDVVLGHDPWKQYRLHPDHQVAGQLTIDGIVAARDPHFFREAGTPHRPHALLLFEAQVVDHVEAVSATAIDAKIAALLEHRSQWRSTMGIDDGASTDEREAQLAAFTTKIRDGLVTGSRSAEAFKLITEL